MAKNWSKIGAGIGFIAMLGLMINIALDLKLNQAQFYFALTLVLFVGMFGYFQVFKD